MITNFTMKDGPELQGPRIIVQLQKWEAEWISNCILDNMEHIRSEVPQELALDLAEAVKAIEEEQKRLEALPSIPPRPQNLVIEERTGKPKE